PAEEASRIHRTQYVAGRKCRFLALLRGNIFEIAARGLKRINLPIYFTARANSNATQPGNHRIPAAEPMREQATEGTGGQGGPFSFSNQAQYRTENTESGGVCLQTTRHGPLVF